MDEDHTAWLQAAVGLPRSKDYQTVTHASHVALSQYQGTSKPPAVGDDDLERRRQLIESLLYSKSFIVSYQVVLVGLLLLIAAFHWAQKIQRARRRHRPSKNVKSKVIDKPPPLIIARRDDSSDESVSSSSSSSTLQGSSTPLGSVEKEQAHSERQPLLPKSASFRRTTQSSATSTLYNRMKAWLIYRPLRKPFIGSLPSNGTTLLITLFTLLNLFYLLYAIPFTNKNISFVLSDRAGLVFVANLPWLYLLSAKNQPIKLLTGHSYEALNIFHRRLGEIMCTVAVVHFIGIFVLWYQFFLPAGLTLGQFLLHKIIWLGLATFVCYQLIYATSRESFRRWWYEIFLASHVVLQLAALILLFFHHSGSRPYVLISLGIFIVDRLVFRLAIKTRPYKTTLTVLDDGATVLVSANWTPPRSTIINSLFPNLRRGWKPTDHVFLSIPALGPSHKLQAHPFTIASAAPVEGEGGQYAWFSLLIRAQDGFSRDLLHYAQRHNSVTSYIDGPYGSSHARELLSTSAQSIVVAGGSGIAVAFPLLWALLNPSLDRAKDPETASGPTGRRKVCLLWVVHSREHVAWLPQERIDELVSWGLEVVTPPPTADAGRPDVPSIINGWVADFEDDAKREEWGKHVLGDIGVVVSGPDGLNREVRNLCSAMVKQDRDVNVAVEKFGW